jgi:hypothetical protein
MKQPRQKSLGNSVAHGDSTDSTRMLVSSVLSPPNLLK